MKQEIEDNFIAMQDEIIDLHNRVDDVQAAAAVAGIPTADHTARHLGGMALVVAVVATLMTAFFGGPSASDLRKIEAEIAAQPTWTCEQVQQGVETQIQNWIVKEERCDTFYRTRRFNETVRHFNETESK